MLQSWSLTFEDEIIRRGILTIAYAGDKYDHIFSNAVDRNFALNGTSTYSATCAASSNNVNPAPASQWLFDPCLNGANAAVTGATQINTNYYRPYPRLHLHQHRRLHRRLPTTTASRPGFIYRLTILQLNAAYTYSKALGNQNQTAQGNLAYGFDSNIGFQNPRNPRGDYGRPSYDRTNVFVTAYVYQPLIFRHSKNFYAREFLSGWGNSGLITVQSGFTTPVSLSSSFAGLATRPNQIAPLIRNSGSGKKALGQSPLYSYTSFAVPGLGTFGNSQPGVLRGPKEVTFATAILKTFPIAERRGLPAPRRGLQHLQPPQHQLHQLHLQLRPGHQRQLLRLRSHRRRHATNGVLRPHLLLTQPRGAP